MAGKITHRCGVDINTVMVSMWGMSQPLDVYLRCQGITNSEFGARIGKTGEAVRRYRSGDRWPDRETMQLIVSATDGAVTPNDFLMSTALTDTPASEPAEAQR